MPKAAGVSRGGLHDGFVPLLVMAAYVHASGSLFARMARTSNVWRAGFGPRMPTDPRADAERACEESCIDSRVEIM